jgi:hypothetical protein
MLLFTVLALLSGAKSYRGIVTFLEQRREHLNHHFGVDLKRAPVVNCIGLDMIGQVSDLGVRLRASDRSDQQAAGMAWLC